jgi:hypothetical protein
MPNRSVEGELINRHDQLFGLFFALHQTTGLLKLRQLNLSGGEVALGIRHFGLDEGSALGRIILPQVVQPLLKDLHQSFGPLLSHFGILASDFDGEDRRGFLRRDFEKTFVPGQTQPVLLLGINFLKFPHRVITHDDRRQDIQRIHLLTEESCTITHLPQLTQIRAEFAAVGRENEGGIRQPHRFAAGQGSRRQDRQTKIPREQWPPMSQDNGKRSIHGGAAG